MKIGEFAFRYRAVVLLPLAFVLIALATPTLESFCIGILVALLGEVLRIWGAGYVGDKSRDTVVQAKELIIAGPYRYVRNPLYLANTLMAVGFVIIASGNMWSWKFVTLLLLILCSYFLVYGIIISYEEKFLRQQYGKNYDDYLRSVPRWIPRISPYTQNKGSYSWRDIRHAEIHTVILLVIMTIIMLLKLSWGR